MWILKSLVTLLSLTVFVSFLSVVRQMPLQTMRKKQYKYTRVDVTLTALNSR